MSSFTDFEEVAIRRFPGICSEVPVLKILERSLGNSKARVCILIKSQYVGFIFIKTRHFLGIFWKFLPKLSFKTADSISY